MIFEPKIVAKDTLFFFASGNGSQRRTQLTYDGITTRVAIWYRVNFFHWYRYPIEKMIEGTGNKDLAYRGGFDSENLKAGTVVEYRIFADLQHDPNNGDANTVGEAVPYRQAVIMGLLEKPIKTRWTHEFKGTPGGTYYHASVKTPGIRTHVLIEVSQQEPVKGPYDTLQFPEMPETTASALGLNEMAYEIDVIPFDPDLPYPRVPAADQRQSLLPGANYYCLIRYSDSAGDWWYEVEKFTTLRRVVTLKADSIYINNDGDPMADGEASFEITFRQSGVGGVTFYLGNDDYKVHTEQTIPLTQLHKWDTTAPVDQQIWPYPVGPVEKVFGPFSVTPENKDISIAVSGVEHDGILEPDEIASTFVEPDFIYYPVGPQEAVSDQTGSVTASPEITGDDFQFTVSYRYSIAYA